MKMTLPFSNIQCALNHSDDSIAMLRDNGGTTRFAFVKGGETTYSSGNPRPNPSPEDWLQALAALAMLPALAELFATVGKHTEGITAGTNSRMAMLRKGYAAALAQYEEGQRQIANIRRGREEEAQRVAQAQAQAERRQRQARATQVAGGRVHVPVPEGLPPIPDGYEYVGRGPLPHLHPHPSGNSDLGGILNRDPSVWFMHNWEGSSDTHFIARIGSEIHGLLLPPASTPRLPAGVAAPPEGWVYVGMGSSTRSRDVLDPDIARWQANGRFWDMTAWAACMPDYHYAVRSGSPAEARLLPPPVAPAPQGPQLPSDIPAPPAGWAYIGVGAVDYRRVDSRDISCWYDGAWDMTGWDGNSNGMHYAVRLGSADAARLLPPAADDTPPVRTPALPADIPAPPAGWAYIGLGVDGRLPIDQGDICCWYDNEWDMAGWHGNSPAYHYAVRLGSADAALLLPPQEPLAETGGFRGVMVGGATGGPQETNPNYYAAPELPEGCPPVPEGYRFLGEGPVAGHEGRRMTRDLTCWCADWGGMGWGMVSWSGSLGNGHQWAVKIGSPTDLELQGLSSGCPPVPEGYRYVGIAPLFGGNTGIRRPETETGDIGAWRECYEEGWDLSTNWHGCVDGQHQIVRRGSPADLALAEHGR